MERFDKKISEKILSKFQSAKDWSDLMTFMKNLKENFHKHNEFNLAELTDKITLAKRISQCLNPQHPPGLHEIAIQVYDLIFENIRKYNNNKMGESLGLYCAGLFPFFQYASPANKNVYLEFITKHILELNAEEFIVCNHGFMVSILPGLDDNDENLVRSIKEVYAKAREKIGNKTFFQGLWSVMLHTNRIRIAGIKYLLDVVPTHIQITKDGRDYEEIKAEYYPNIRILVLNSIIACNLIISNQ